MKTKLLAFSAVLIVFLTAFAILAIATLTTATQTSSLTYRLPLAPARAPVEAIAAMGRSAPDKINITIESPRDGQVITGPVYNWMSGTSRGNLPEGVSLWVVAQDECLYYLVHPRTTFTPSTGEWCQDNIRLGYEGRWQLHVCIADLEASYWCKDRAERNDSSGFLELPKGMVSIALVTVSRENAEPGSKRFVSAEGDPLL